MLFNERLNENSRRVGKSAGILSMGASWCAVLVVQDKAQTKAEPCGKEPTMLIIDHKLGPPVQEQINRDIVQLVVQTHPRRYYKNMPLLPNQCTTVIPRLPERVDGIGTSVVSR